MNNPASGVSYFMRGVRLIFRPGLLRYTLVPLVINILIFGGLFFVAKLYFNDLVNYLLSYLPSWLSFLSYLFWLLFYIVGAIIVFFTFSLLANIIGAPFNSYLAAAVEKRLTGDSPQGEQRSMSKEIIVSMGSEARKWGYYLMYALPLFLISLFPITTPFSPILWFIFGAWMYGLEYVEYSLGNHGQSFVQVRKTLRQKRFLGLGFGAVVTLASMIPVVNFIVMPAAVAGATVMRVEQFPLNEAQD